MKATSLFGLVGLCGVALVVGAGCGSPASSENGAASGAERGPNPTASIAARTVDELPQCGAENVGEVAAVAASDALHQCTTHGWMAVPTTLEPWSSGKSVGLGTEATSSSGGGFEVPCLDKAGCTFLNDDNGVCHYWCYTVAHLP